MKRCLKTLAASLLLLFAVSCSDTARDTPEIDASSTTVSTSEVTEGTEEPPIVLAVVYENYAWVEEQEVKIYDSGGSRYFYVYGEGYGEGDDNFLWLDFSKKDLQDTMRKIAELGSVTEVSDEALKAISDFSGKYEEGLTKKYKEYESGLRDYGGNMLYGIYYDDGAPKYVLLCQYGNQIKCLDDEDVINFANQMIELGVFPTAHHEDFRY